MRIAGGSCDNLSDGGKKAACSQSDLQSAKSECAQTAAR
jgi:hypothetical protein